MVECAVFITVAAAVGVVVFRGLGALFWLNALSSSLLLLCHCCCCCCSCIACSWGREFVHCHCCCCVPVVSVVVVVFCVLGALVC